MYMRRRLWPDTCTSESISEQVVRIAAVAATCDDHNSGGDGGCHGGGHGSDDGNSEMHVDWRGRTSSGRRAEARCPAGRSRPDHQKVTG